MKSMVNTRTVCIALSSIYIPSASGCDMHHHQQHTPAFRLLTPEDASSTPASFCSGEGSVMLNGFQSTAYNSCVRLFFRQWVLNTEVKYFFGLLGCFLIALLNEYLVKYREGVRQELQLQITQQPHKKAKTNRFNRLRSQSLLALLYMLQMAMAYFAMLVVMTYETGLFIALVLGFGMGFLLFKDLEMDISNEPGVWRYVDPSTLAIRVQGMICKQNCASTVKTALQDVSGVTKVFVDFDKGMVYVAGIAATKDLIDAIKEAGYTGDLA